MRHVHINIVFPVHSDINRKLVLLASKLEIVSLRAEGVTFELGELCVPLCSVCDILVRNCQEEIIDAYDQ